MKGENKMDGLHHNEIIEIPMNIEVCGQYPVILNNLLIGKKTGHSCYFNFFVQYQTGKMLVMRTKNCIFDKQIEYELADKYMCLYKISVKNDMKITIIKVTINNTGCKQ
jgi:hypothetical protein